jgi:broad-specificity NMP kinase
MSKRPNILITGTPGTGKTSLAEAIADVIGFTRINVTEVSFSSFSFSSQFLS